MSKSNTRRRSKRPWYKEVLLNPATLKWGFFILRLMEVLRKLL